MKVGIWIRVSTEDQAKGESPKNHEKRARMYAELKGWKVVELYDLSGVSGKSVIEHPEAQRMLQDVSKGKIKALIFSKLARLARNVRELLEISDHFQKYGADLVSIEESIDTSTPAGRLLFTVIGALAQWEREEISARVSASVPVRAMQGMPTGGQGPFGYHWVNKKLVPHPEEAVVVKEIYNTFLETKKILTTSKIINEKGYRSRKGAKFGKTTIKRILTDPVYKGQKRANYTKSKGNKKSWVLKPENDWVWFNVEPIIDSKTWEEVNAIIEKNARPFPKLPPCVYSARYPFSGLVYCECGSKMYVMKYKGMKIPKYRCRKCNNKIKENILMEQFKEGLKCMVVKPEQLQAEMEAEEKIINQKEKELQTLSAELKKVNLKIDKLIDMYNDDLLQKDIFRERLNILQERKQQIEETIPEIEAEIAFYKVSETGKDYILTQATTLYSIWDELEKESQIKIIKEILSSIRVTKDKLEYEFYFLPEFMEFCKSDHNFRGSWLPRA